MRLVIRAMVECERGQNVKKSKDESNSSDDDESMYDSEEEMHAKTEKANKMKREKETRKKTKNSAVGRLKRLVPRSKPDRMLVQHSRMLNSVLLLKGSFQKMGWRLTMLSNEKRQGVIEEKLEVY